MLLDLSENKGQFHLSAHMSENKGNSSQPTMTRGSKEYTAIFTGDFGMEHSDFKLINFDEQFNSNNTSATRTFTVDGNPIDTGYLLIQCFDVENNNHQILINNRDLPSFDIPTHNNNQWFTWMDRIPSGFLQQGQNRITIRRSSTNPNDGFFVANVVINWRENS